MRIGPDRIRLLDHQLDWNGLGSVARGFVLDCSWMWTGLNLDSWYSPKGWAEQVRPSLGHLPTASRVHQFSSCFRCHVHDVQSPKKGHAIIGVLFASDRDHPTLRQSCHHVPLFCGHCVWRWVARSQLVSRWLQIRSVPRNFRAGTYIICVTLAGCVSRIGIWIGTYTARSLSGVLRRYINQTVAS